MPGPSRSTRRPAVAGRFYPASETECVTLAQQYVRASPAAEKDVAWRGAIVPHAGWMFSGEIAGEAIGTLAASREGAAGTDASRRGPQVVVVFGAVHTPLPLDRAAMDVHLQWQVPGGLSDVPAELSGKLGSESSEMFGVDARFHEREHAVEVELPLIQRAFPGALVMPIEVPLIDAAPQIGIATARVVQSLGLDAVYLASSDLTHYGTDFSFTPAGDSFAALEWAKDNDRRLLDLLADVAVADVAVERIVPEVRERANACGGGAIAAMLAACREHGNSSRVQLLKHETSDDVLKRISSRRRSHNAVGYAGLVVG